MNWKKGDGQGLLFIHSTESPYPIHQQQAEAGLAPQQQQYEPEQEDEQHPPRVDENNSLNDSGYFSNSQAYAGYDVTGRYA